jgi:3-methylfumaryl-CoA hydratase
MTQTRSSDKAPISGATIAHLQTWVGKTQTLHDRVSAREVAGLAATLDRADAPPETGTVLPPLWHWMYFAPVARQSELGPDGHPERGHFLPPVPLPRRMWAGSRLHWNAANSLRVGEEITLHSRIAAVEHKAGRSGDLVFVQVQHECDNASGWVVREAQDLVYRAAAEPGAPAPQPKAAETQAPWQRQITPDPVLLFRYSALTFNSHRIHYDRSYVTQVEGYPGLVVHGPLLATLLLDLLRRRAPGATVLEFSFKAIRPTFDLHPFTLLGQPAADGRTVALWAHDHEGWLTMQAEATVQTP